MTIGIADQTVGEQVEAVYSKLLELKHGFFDDYKLRWSEKATTKSGEEVLLYSFDFKSSGGDPFRAIALIVASAKRVIEISGSCVSDEFDRYEGVFRAIIASVVLT